MDNFKRIVSMLLCLVMVLSAVPVSALAVETDQPDDAVLTAAETDESQQDVVIGDPNSYEYVLKTDGELKSGEYYLIHNNHTNKYLTNQKTNNANRLNLVSNDQSYAWCIEKVDGGYTVQMGDQYLTIGHQSAAMSDTAQTILLSTVRVDENTYWAISANVNNQTPYLAREGSSSSSSSAHGYASNNYLPSNDAGMRWNLYERKYNSVTYSVGAENMILTLPEDGSGASGVIEPALLANGTEVSSIQGTWSFGTVADDDGVIASLDAQTGAIVFNDQVGTATVRVSFTWSVDENTYTASKVVTVGTKNGISDTSITIGEEKIVYVLASTIRNGKEYLIVNASSGSGFALANNDNDTNADATAVEIKTDDAIGTYIELADASQELWQASGSSTSFSFKNGDKYVDYVESDDGASLELNTTCTWSYSSNRLSVSIRSGFWSNTYYLRYSNGWRISTSQSNVYFYTPTQIGEQVTYTMDAKDLSVVLLGDGTTTTGKLDYALLANGEKGELPAGGTYRFTKESGDDIIGSIDENGNVTFNGTTGSATVRVAYTWTEGGERYTVYKLVNVQASEPYYSIELCEPVTVDGVTKHEPITAPIAKKGVKAGNKMSIWAVVKAHSAANPEGVDLGDVEDGLLYWTVSNENIAEIDEATGVITFSGEEFGTFQVTVHYLDEEGKSLCSDTITVSATEEEFIVPGDGTDDFPEYPNEGAVRFDKTATAVGNFSQTGTALVELSMTGVPIGKGTDVIIMLDTSSSMEDWCICGTKNCRQSGDAHKRRNKVLEDSLAKLIAQLKSPNADGDYMDINVAIADFNGYYGDDAGTDGTPYDRTSGDYVKDGNSNGSGYSQSSQAQVYTGSKALNANAFIPVSELAESYTLNYASGTNYDYAFDAIAQMATAIQDKNEVAGDDRELIVIFMSDGASLQWNYFGTQNSYTKWNDWLAGGWSASDLTTSNLNSTTHSYYYEMDADGDGQYNEHRMASAIKGSPDETFEVIRKNQNDSDNQDSLFDRLTPVDGKENLYTMKGLGATMYTINFDARDDGEILQENIDKALASTASDSGTGTTQYYYKITTADQLDDAFKTIGNAITYAAKNVKVEDKIKDSYTVNFALPQNVNSAYLPKQEGEEGEVKEFEFYIQAVEYQLDADKERTGEFTVLERFTFDLAGNLTSHTVDGVTCENCTHVTYRPSGGRNGIRAINGTYFDYTCEPAADAEGNYLYNEKGDVISEEYITWKADKLTTTELALQYFVYLDNSAGYPADDQVDPGTYDTNEYATLTYENYKGNEVQQEFPVPQMTWNGAQVSYVFYLVNEDGQPVNRAGRVVPFAEAVYVTDVYTRAVVWNEEHITSLEADLLAEKLVPDVYALYDDNASYSIHVYEDESDTDMGNYFVIGGNVADDESTGKGWTNPNTTYVFNTKHDSVKYNVYGTYDNNKDNENETVRAGFDFANTTVAFAVVWKPALVPDAVVVDYGLDVLIDVTTNDSMASGLVGVRTNAPANVVMNTGSYTAAKVNTVDVRNSDNVKIGTATVETMNGVRFSLDKDNGMQFNKSAVFYYESDVNYYNSKGDLITTGMYSSVTVIPATTIYYEDDFIQFASFTADEKGNFSDEADKDNKWATAAQNGLQEQDRPGESKISETLDADNNYGYDAAYTSMSTYSMGSAAKITVDANTRGEAYFTFYGTGFDVIGLTSNTSGTILVQVNDAQDNLVRSTIVDTYYGYTRDKDGEWVVTNDVANSLYQVPVIKIFDLPYGQYSAKIMAVYNSIFDHTANGEGSENKYDLYLDAVRIYDPTGGNDETANDAYITDGEGWPEYFEVRDQILGKDTFDSLDADAVSGIVYIDGVNRPSLAEYAEYGPNNEVYLSKDNAIAFELNATAKGGEVQKIQLAVKTVGGTGRVEVYGINNGTKTDCLDETVSTATDMYYDITALNGQTVVIKSTGDAIISITNVKVTYTESQDVENSEDNTTRMMFAIRRSTADAALASMVEEEIPETTVPEETVPETTVPEETEPEETVPETTVPEETEPEEDNPGNHVPDIGSVVEQIIGVIGKLIGWFFGR